MAKLMKDGQNYTGSGNINLTGGGSGGATVLNDLLDVNTPSPVDGNALFFDGTEWVASNIPSMLVRQEDCTSSTTSANYRLLFSYNADSNNWRAQARKSDLLTYNPATCNLINRPKENQACRIMVRDSSGKGMFLEQGTDGGKGLHFTDGSYVYTLILADASNNVTIGNKLQSAIKALFSDLCKINTFTKRYSLNAGATASFKNDFITVPNGYTIGAILGFSTNNANACMISLRPDNGGNYDIEFKNVGSGNITDGTFWIKILFIKSDFISWVS